VSDKIYLDTYVFMDVLSGKEEFSGKAAQYLQLTDEKVVSVILLSELSHHLTRRRAVAEDIIYVLEAVPNFRIIELTEEIAILAGKLRAKYHGRLEKHLTYFDAIHLATAITEQCSKFVTGDKAFKEIEEIKVEVY
jgi:predicted nucleic acid-binding protein